MTRSLVLCNRRFAVAFDDRQRLRDLHWPRLGEENHLVGRPCHLGVVAFGVPVWIDDRHAVEHRMGRSGMLGGARIVLPEAALHIVETDAVDPTAPLLMRRIEVFDPTGSPRRVRLLIHHDLALLESDLGNCVRHDGASRTIVHFKRDRWMALDIQSPGGRGVTHWTLGRNDEDGGRGIRAQAARGELSRNPVAMGAGESLIAVDLDLPEGGRSEVILALCMGRAEVEVRAILGGMDDLCLAMDRIVTKVEDAARPADIGALGSPFDEAYEAAVGICVGHCDSGGGIVAALDSGAIGSARDTYGYVWPRDGAMIARALTRAGKVEIALEYFAWCERTLEAGGYFAQRYTASGRLGSTWHPTTDDVGRLPIQEDESALVLWSLARLALEVGAGAAESSFETLALPIAEFLVRYRDLELCLPKPSHDLWEERFGIHAFTTLAVIGALTSASEWAARRGAARHAENWRDVAELTTRAFERHFFHDDAHCHARTLHVHPDRSYWLDVTPDASLFHLVLFEGLGGLSPTRVEATLTRLSRALTVRSPAGGHARYVDDHYWRQSHDLDWVPGNPWPLATLWKTRAELARDPSPAGLLAAESAIRSCLATATSAGLMPEQRHPLTGAPLSVCPLPWNHAALIETVLDLEAARRHQPSRII